jgi:hypothetical protein
MMEGCIFEACLAIRVYIRSCVQVHDLYMIYGIDKITSTILLSEHQMKNQ